jgi:hypothetical protein
MARSRATIFEVGQIGVEDLTTPGTAVSATKRLQALGFSIAPQVETSRFRPQGYKYDTLVIPGKDFTNVTVEGRLDYTNIQYALASVLGAPALSTVGTNGRAWNFVSHPDSEDVLQTYTLDVGSAVRAHRVAGMAFTGLDFNFTRDEATLSGSAIGKNLQDPVYISGPAVVTLTPGGTISGGTFTVTYSGQTTSAIDYDATADELQTALWALSNVAPGDIFVSGGPGPAAFVLTFAGNLAPGVQTVTVDDANLTGSTPDLSVVVTQAGVAITEVAAKPIIPSNVNVYVDRTFGAIGTSKLTRLLTGSVSIQNRVSPLWVINASEDSYATTLENATDITAMLKMEANAVGMSHLADIRDGDTVYIRIEAEGEALPAPDAAENYNFVLDLAAKVESPGGMGDTDGAYTMDWNFRAVHDADMGGAIEVTVTNLATAL